jgi:hypothetical protein
LNIDLERRLRSYSFKWWHIRWLTITSRYAMTITHRKRQHLPDEILGMSLRVLARASLTVLTAINEPGVQTECDSCTCDLTHSVVMKCADPVCETGDGIDICPACFCSGKEFGKHKRGHQYRVVVSRQYIFCAPFLSAHPCVRNCTRIQYSQKTGAQMSEYYFCWPF